MRAISAYEVVDVVFVVVVAVVLVVETAGVVTGTTAAGTGTGAAVAVVAEVAVVVEEDDGIVLFRCGLAGASEAVAEGAVVPVASFKLRVRR